MTQIDETKPYFEPRQQLPNGLTLLQVNPDCAVDLRPDSATHQWLFVKHFRGAEWTTLRRLEGAEFDQAWDQAVDGCVLQGTKVRAG